MVTAPIRLQYSGQEVTPPPSNFPSTPALPLPPHLGTSGSLPTALQAYKHNDIVLALGGLPDGHSGVDEGAQLVEHCGLDDTAFVQARCHLIKVNGCSIEERGCVWIEG